ncbi:MAG: nitroreductase family protein [Polynucleobacter sp. 32-46-5]|nr:MAG: nitroreductase family protein [Polynucleobacter sp. 32-46-5]
MPSSTDIFNEVPKIDYQENTPSIDTAEFIKVIESRRSVRVYTRESIPAHIVNKCLDLALLAPTSSNLQNWEFYWVRSLDKKQEIVKACLSQPAARTAPELIVAVSRLKTWPQMRLKMLDLFKNSTTQVPYSARVYYESLVPLVYGQGPLGIKGLIKKVAIFFRGLSTPTPRGPVSKADMRVWAHKTTALACENFMLAMRAHGYDTCPMEGFDEVKIKRVLQLPRDAEVTMVISAGKRAKDGVYGPRVRFERELFIKEI